MVVADNTSTLVVNLSLRSVRIILITDNGQKLYEDWRPVRTSIHASSVEQNPTEWWELLLELFSTLALRTDLTSHIRYISVTSSALCLVAVGRSGNPLGHSIMVADTRATKEAEEMAERFAPYFQAARGVKADASFMMPKILWIARNEPERFKKTYKFLSANDYLIARLTGTYVTDYLTAQKCYYDPVTHTYHQEINTYCGVKTTQFPTVQDPGTLVGPLVPRVAKTLGVGHTIAVALSTYDAICALIGGTRYEEGELTTVCGTCSSYRMFTSSSIHSFSDNFLVQVMPSEERVIIGGSNNLEGGVIEWAKECFYGDSYQKDDDFLYSLMQSEAAESPPGARGIVFLPYLLGERIPFSDPYVRGMFFGIERFHKRPDIMRSVFEAVGYEAHMMVDEFEKNDISVLHMTMSGGVSQMETAVQIRADVLGIPIHVLSEVETTAFGAFICTLKARGLINHLSDGSAFITVKKTVIPNMHNHNAYSSLYLLFKQLYTANKSLFKRHAQVTAHIAKYRTNILEYL